MFIKIAVIMITSFFKITSFDWACMMDQTPKYYTPYIYIHFCILQTQQSGGVGINTGILYTQHLRHGDVGWLASNHTAEPKFKSDPSHKDGKPNSSIISPSFFWELSHCKCVGHICRVFANNMLVLSVVRRLSPWALRVFDTVMVLTANSSRR